MSDESKFKEVISILNKRREATGLDKGGKKYSMVKDRVEVFRETFGSEYGIVTDVDYSMGFEFGSIIVGKAHIIDRQNNVLASGTAMEIVGSNEVTKTSAVEAVETSAIGRALACFGLHGGEYASDFEMVAVDRKQEAVQQQPVHRPQMPDDSVKNYIPREPNAVWFDSAAELARVADNIAAIREPGMLSRYWHELQEFRQALEKHEPALFAELRATFNVQHKSISNVQ